MTTGHSKYSCFLYSLLLFLLLKCGLTLAEYKLELAQVLFRHGDRNPIITYPNDPYKDESFWPEGYGQLTELGKRQLHSLGQFLRHRYTGLLSDSYSPYEVHVKSSGENRTLMSAKLVVQGLFSLNTSSGDQKQNQKLPWGPIPIHMLPSHEDNILHMTKPCPRHDFLVEEFNKGSFMKSRFEESRELIQFLEFVSGKELPTIQSWCHLYDALYIEWLRNYSLPTWTKGIFPSDPENPSGQFFDVTRLLLKVPTWNEEMKRLKAGPLMKDIAGKIENHITTNDDVVLINKPKLFLYSAHDMTIANLLNSLGVFNGLPPPYAATVMMELYRNVGSGEYVVQIHYRNSSNHSPHLLKLPGCETYCPIEKMMELIGPLIPEDWESECQSMDAAVLLNLSFYILAIIPVIIMIVVLLSVLCLSVSRRKFYFHIGGTNNGMKNEKNRLIGE